MNDESVYYTSQIYNLECANDNYRLENEELKEIIYKLENTDYQRYKDEIKELDQTITDLNTIIVNLQLENEELKRQVKYGRATKSF